MFKRYVAATLAACTLLLGATTASAYDRRMIIDNETSETLVELHASNVSRSTWEEDILGTEVIGSGERAMVNLNDGSGYCLFDFKAVFEDGYGNRHTVVRPRVNVCTVALYTFYD